MDTNETTGHDKKLQDDLKDSAHKIWLAGLGALAAAEKEGAKVFNRLVERGREVESKGKVDFKEQVDNAKVQVDKAKAKVEGAVEDWTAKLDEAVTSTLHRLGVPTREEIRTLTQRVEELNAKVEQLKPRVTPAAAGTAKSHVVA
jgi:poly(hydroxyalkanoate) granule-associated protein